MAPPPPSHSQAVLPNPTTLILEKIDREGDDFRLSVYSHQPVLRPMERVLEEPSRELARTSHAPSHVEASAAPESIF